MTQVERLILLKLNLLITTEAFDESLQFFLDSAVQLLAREGIKEEADDSTEFDYLVITYAAFLYNVRRNQDGKNAAALPLYLRNMINTYKYNHFLKGGG